jgi:cation transport ATPase
MNDLERILRDDARAKIADGGFTERVMAALPARAAAERAWLRPALVLGSAALGSVLAVVLAPGSYTLMEGFADLLRLRAFTPAALMAVGIGGALLASAVVLAFETD